MFVCPTCGQRYPSGGYCATDGAQLAATDDPLLGTEIDRYRIARTLGEGGMGKVYLAVQPAIGSRVAIKLLSDQCAKTPELVERFFAEARAVNLIRHEHIVGVLDMARLPDGRPFIVMEFVEGATLADIVRTTVAPLGGVVQVMGEVLAALGAAHAIGIVHRDLKPDNILVTAQGHAKVLDFGIAKLAPNLRDVGAATRTGALLGTPAYMAPEQISGAGNVDGRADIYAAGVVLFEAVTGEQPFRAASMFDLMRAHVEQMPPRPTALRPDLPPSLEQIILTALSKDPSQRFQSAGAMAQALAHASAELPAEAWRPLSRGAGPVVTPRISAGGFTPPTPRNPTPPAQPPSDPTERRHSHAVAPLPTQARSRTPLWIALAVVLVAGIAAVAIAVMPRREVAVVQPPTPPTPVGPDAAIVVAIEPTIVDAAIADSPIDAGVVAKPSAQPRAPAKPASPAVVPATAATHDVPPTIVGGGSAADHGVVIGPNVHMGPGVVIGGNSPPAASKKSLTLPVDYNPRDFDPLAYIGRAEAIARQLLPDARLTEFEFDPVWSDGHVDLTKSGRDRYFEFRSAAASARPADVPRNLAVDRACMINVDIEPTGITAEVRSSETCDAPFVRRPRCHFAAVWQQAVAAGTPRDMVARIAWLKDEQWFFDTDLGGAGGRVSSFPDTCR
jgi:serine/threonine protein kinase